MAKKNPMDDFAVAGSINKKIFAEGLGFECPDNMYLLGYVTDEEAKTLMRDCKAFLFPSFYEGFGIPPLEAVSAGAKKVVVSDIPVMHEIFGETANYINPVKNEKISVLHDIQRDVLNKYAWSLSAKKNAGIAMAINWEWEKKNELYSKNMLYNRYNCHNTFLPVEV